MTQIPTVDIKDPVAIKFYYEYVMARMVNLLVDPPKLHLLPQDTQGDPCGALTRTVGLF